jgi:DNA topoisomerase-1
MNHAIYLNDPGIYKKDNKFYYHSSGTLVLSTTLLDRISKIRVPPAWKHVWYSSNNKCHIQVHGIDSNGKKQYILSESWIKSSKCRKYNRIKSFIKDLESFKRKITLKTWDCSKKCLIHLLFQLLINTHIRVGNEKYAENNKTYGLTTLRQKHLVNGTFSFVGKSGISHTIEVPNHLLVYIKNLYLQSPNKPLFWYSEQDKMKVIDSEELNVYLKENMGKEYTCKDFRTYSANILFIKAFLKNAKGGKDGPKKIILQSIDESARLLGHTRNISRKSYISEKLINYCLDSFDKASGSSVDSLLSTIWS